MRTLPDGLVAFVKKDCPTCELIVPVLAQLGDADPMLIVTQDDPDFPSLDDVVHDAELELSWSHEIETVPTLLQMRGGEEVARIVGWSRPAWEEFTGINELGVDLPDHRPGCGSMSVEPDRAAALEATFGNGLVSRRIEFAELDDEFEAMYERGWSDGLPVVPPTPQRVLGMLGGTSRGPDEVVVIVPPNLVECTVEKVAINAVLAGCRPEYMPVVLAALEAVCTDEFNMHGVLATTMGVGPVLIVNGPIRHEIAMNSGMNVFGQGNRANSTIGRAVQLCVLNVGGGRPGELDRATQGNPGKTGLCFAEDEEGSPWEPLSVSRGFAAGTSTVTAFTGEAPRIIVDQLSRTPELLAASLAQALMANVHPSIAGMDAVLVLSPEHMERFATAGWGRARFLDELSSHLVLDAGATTIATGGRAGRPDERPTGKFPPDGLLVVHAGGNAGLFSSTLAGWVSGPKGSVPVTREIIR